MKSSLNVNSLVFAVFLCSQLLAATAGLNSYQANILNQTGDPRVDWFFAVNSSGSTSVTVLVDDVSESELQFCLPKTYQSFKISSDMNYTITETNGSSYNLLTICNISVSSLSFTFTWPDGGIQYKDVFYFAGQEKFEVGLGNVTVWLPKKASVFWVEGSNITGDYEMLSFECKKWDLLPSFSYSFVGQPRINMSLRTSDHVNLQYHPVMIGKPWINKTVETIEQNWNWLKTTLNGTIDQVDITFAPYGYNDLGVKKGGLCYYNSRDIEIVATEQFGIGFNGWNTALVLHELSHAFTPLLEDLPSFFSEAVAEDCSYAALKRTDLNETADSLEESRFADAYWHGVQQGLLDYIWLWKWNDTIYDNFTITKTCYGISAFVGDYIVHHWGYAALRKLNAIFNKTEINALNESQRFMKFAEYLSLACNFNMSEIFSNLAILINQWNDAYHMCALAQNYEVTVIGPFTWHISSKLENLVKDANFEYNYRNYNLSISKFDEARALVNSGYWQSLDCLFWLVVTMVIVGGIILLVRRRRFAQDLKSSRILCVHAHREGIADISMCLGFKSNEHISKN